jgi:hypothetical protein
MERAAPHGAVLFCDSTKRTTRATLTCSAYLDATLGASADLIKVVLGDLAVRTRARSVAHSVVAPSRSAHLLRVLEDPSRDDRPEPGRHDVNTSQRIVPTTMTAPIVKARIFIIDVFSASRRSRSSKR